LTELQQFLKQTASMLGSANSNRINRYSSIYDFVHQRGQSFVPQKLPKGYKRGIIKECFRNALLLANSEPNLIYCEGYACGAVIPVYHAWCCDGKGKVLEVTWDKPGSEYIGVPIQTDYACKIVDRAGYYGVIDQYSLRWPIFSDAEETWRDARLKLATESRS
jgi:hypothetical protein